MTYSSSVSATNIRAVRLVPNVNFAMLQDTLPSYDLLKQNIMVVLIAQAKRKIEGAWSWEKKSLEDRIKSIESGIFTVSWSDTAEVARFAKNPAYECEALGKKYKTKDSEEWFDDHNKDIPINSYIDYLAENGLCQPR